MNGLSSNEPKSLPFFPLSAMLEPLVLCFPASLCGLPGYLATLFLAELLCSCRPALQSAKATQRNSSRVLLRLTCNRFSKPGFSGLAQDRIQTASRLLSGSTRQLAGILGLLHA